ncbi:unnamed protein product [Larinioides sclopetarius]|uniref:Uncharacterized protein n=1 Tax=Larinioides sclopetarius TaxID=280406 RepID=A0AAV1ZWU8_9ARAC
MFSSGLLLGYALGRSHFFTALRNTKAPFLPAKTAAQTLARVNSISRKERQFLQQQRRQFLRKETQSDSSSPLGEDEDWNSPRSYQFSIKQNFVSA